MLRQVVRDEVTSTWMAGPKASQQNIAQSFKLPPPACLLPVVHPGAMGSPGKRCTCTQTSTWCKRKRDSSDQASFFHYRCPCVFGGGQRSAWAPWLVCGYASSYATNYDALCILAPILTLVALDSFSRVMHHVGPHLKTYRTYFELNGFSPLPCKQLLINVKNM